MHHRGICFVVRLPPGWLFSLTYLSTVMLLSCWILIQGLRRLQSHIWDMCILLPAKHPWTAPDGVSVLQLWVCSAGTITPAGGRTHVAMSTPCGYLQPIRVNGRTMSTITYWGRALQASTQGTSFTWPKPRTLRGNSWSV